VHAHARGGGTRAVCLTPGYQSRQTYGLHHSAASGGGTSKVNQRTARGGTPTVNQCTVHSGTPIVNHRTVIGGIHDPVRGQSSIAGDAIPGKVVRWKMIAAAGVDCDGIRNAPPRNAMACDFQYGFVYQVVYGGGKG